MLGGVNLYGATENGSPFASGELVKAAQEVADFLRAREILGKSQDVAPLFDGGYVNKAM